jgi:deoxyribose-phosphate aldolase
MDRIARYIDHTLVRPDTTQTQITRLCEEAVEHRFAAVAVNQVYARFASSLLQGCGIAVAVAVAFPLGVTSTQVKSYEAERALDDGASELDVMINLGALKGGQYALVEQDIAAVTRICHDAGAICKAILETGLLTDDEKVHACQLAAAAGADFVKTSTGFGPSGATVADVSLMRRTVGPSMGVKAAGGIRTYQEALALIQAGANRLGVSAAASLEMVLCEKELLDRA